MRSCTAGRSGCGCATFFAGLDVHVDDNDTARLENFGTLGDGLLKLIIRADGPKTDSALRFDAGRLRQHRDGGTCIVRPDAKVQNFKQAFTETLVVGAAGRGTAIGDKPVWINNLLKTKLKIVAGYKGSPDTMIAFERGGSKASAAFNMQTLPCRPRTGSRNAKPTSSFSSA